MPLSIIRIGRYVLLGVGAGLVLLAGFVQIRRRVKAKREEREGTNYSSINNLLADESSPLLND